MAKLSYKKAGVNIDVANDAKRQMKKILDSNNKRVLNKVGAFATLFDGTFKGYKHPVLVFKTEEPGTKQKLALQNNSVESICFDLVNHLVNDAIVMGAKPLSIQDCIVCGKLEKKVILEMVAGLSKAARENGCALTGGETSEQPGVVEEGTYIMTASIVAVVDKDKIIDGSKIQAGDIVLALASSGIHTNGLSLARKIMQTAPKVLKEKVNGKPFVRAILVPHRGYYNALKDLFGKSGLVGLAHITGGGIKENLNRVLPKGLDARIELDAIKVHPIFKTMKKFGNLEDPDMLRTFNMGVGLTAVVKPAFAKNAIAHIKKMGIDTYQIGTITIGNGAVEFVGEINWKK